MMNCKQGDLAIVLPGIHPKHAHKVGTLVRCEAPKYDEIRSLPGWIVDPPLGEDFWDGFLITGSWVLDKRLKPIRDPGDDARDETLEWLPVPSINKTQETT